MKNFRVLQARMSPQAQQRSIAERDRLLARMGGDDIRYASEPVVDGPQRVIVDAHDRPVRRQIGFTR